jgi:hypothetical protein
MEKESMKAWGRQEDRVMPDRELLPVEALFG